MITDSIEQEVRIDAPIDVVWETITDPAHISRWFTDKAEVDLRPGGEVSITWVDHGVTETLHIVDVEEPNLFSFRWLNPKDQQADASNSTLVEFKLSTDGDATVLRLIESGFSEIGWAEDTKESAISDHINGWTTHTEALSRYFASERQVSARS